MGLSFFVRIPQARPLLSPAGSSSGSWLQGGTQGGWTEFSSSAESLPSDHLSFCTVFAGSRSPEWNSDTLEFVSIMCVLH